MDWTTYRGHGRPQIPASDAFKLHDTYGFPIDLTRVMAEERGMTVDVAGFEQLMEQAREVSRAKSGEAAGGRGQIALPPDAIARLKAMGVEPTQDIDKYHGRPIAAEIKAIWNGDNFDNVALPGRHVAIILDRTSFYAEAGGQVGDRGTLHCDYQGGSLPVRGQGLQRAHGAAEFRIEDTRAFGPMGESYVLHIGVVTQRRLTVGDRVEALVDVRREAIRANHTATHLLNLALREVLGDDVNQKGSLVADDRLRFDFSAPHVLRHAEIERVESIVNDHIRKSMRVHADNVPLATAKRIRGVRAVFGEKYPDPVRVVCIGVPVAKLIENPGSAEWTKFSVEFCGGTHLDSTDGARVFVIVSEQALAAGVRRIVALTGAAAQAADTAARELERRAINAAKLADDLVVTDIDDINHQLEALTIGTVARHRIHEALESLRPRIKSLRKTAQAASRNTVVDQARALVERSNGRIIVEQVDGADKDSLLAAMDVVRARRPDAAAMLLSANEIEGKVMIVAAVPKSFIDLGLKAGEWVKQAAAICGGSGGGRPDLAQAGGKDPTKVPAAIDAARMFAQQKIGGA